MCGEAVGIALLGVHGELREGYGIAVKFLQIPTEFSFCDMNPLKSARSPTCLSVCRFKSQLMHWQYNTYDQLVA